MAYQLILASASPRRKELLERIGFTTKIVPADVSETMLDAEEPAEFVKRMARFKVLTVVNRVKGTLPPQATAALDQHLGTGMGITSREPPARWIVGADTIVVLDGEVLGKPKDVDQAFEMLQKLSGREHVVVTGFCVFDLLKNKEGIQAVTSRVKIKRMSRPEIEKYLSAGESLDKAGAYAVQGVGAYLIDSIQGSYSNVVGLPLCQLMEMLEEMGAHDILPY
jgi:septum formation protein